MEVKNKQRHHHYLTCGRDEHCGKPVSQAPLNTISLEPCGKRRLEQPVMMRRARDLFRPRACAPEQHFTKHAYTARTSWWNRRFTRWIPGTDRRARLQQRPRNHHDCEHGQKRQLKRRIEDGLWTMNQEHERRRTERIQRTRFTKQQEREPGERKHDRRSHNRCFPTNHYLKSPYEKGRHNELQPPSATQSFYDKEDESAD